jgi:aryl-alcohol dehydrogenase-like predicted oxidoreductase
MKPLGATKQLGNSDMNLTSIGFGAWAIGGGDWQSGWGPQDDTESVDAIHRALDAGVNWIDTAAVYGLGHSEEIVGHAIEGKKPSFLRDLQFLLIGPLWTLRRWL